MNFESTSERVETLRAAAHPVRLAILAELLAGPKCVTDIRELLNARQPNVSQHLLVLKHAGLVSVSREGAFRCYYLPKPDQIRAIFRLLEKDYPTVSPAEVRKKFRRTQERRARR